MIGPARAPIQLSSRRDVVALLRHPGLWNPTARLGAISLSLPWLDRARAEALEADLNRWSADCGCKAGSIVMPGFLLAALLARTLLFGNPLPADLTDVAVLFLVLFAGAVGGKLSGILGARARLAHGLRALLRDARPMEVKA